MLDVVLCWGKSLKVFESTRIRATHHPAICHMLDVGLMSQALLEQAGAKVALVVTVGFADLPGVLVRASD